MVPRFFRMTVALGTIAPEGSVMVPVTCAVDCAFANGVARENVSNVTEKMPASFANFEGF